MAGASSASPQDRDCGSSRLRSVAARCVQHIIGVLQHVLIPEPYDDKAQSFQMGAPLGISRRVLRMLPAIDLDDELRIDTDEIGNVSFDRHLPAKLPAVELSVAQMPPQAAFGRRLLSPEISRELFDVPHPLRSARDPPGRGKFLDSISPPGGGKFLESLPDGERARVRAASRHPRTRDFSGS